MATPISFIIPKLLFSGSLVLLCLVCFSRKGFANEGRKTVENHHLHHSHIVQTSSLLPTPVCRPSTKGLKKSSSLRVVHRHGPCSPLSQAMANAPTAAQILAQDQARVDSIHSRANKNFAGNNLLHSKPTTLQTQSVGSGNYIVTVGLGTPAKSLSLIFDTGSDLSWTQCKPCLGSCYPQKEPTFDPSMSTSYSNITCNSPLCSQITSATGNPPNCLNSTCVYGIQYGDRSFSAGFFAKEKLTITPSDVFNNFLFGCGQNNQGLFGNAAGLLGLGRNNISMVWQTAKKYGRFFSYCLPSRSSSTGYLTFGNDGIPSSTKFTPLLTNSKGLSFYFIDMVAISVRGRRLSIATSVFSTAGTIIDSGTVITRLPPAAYAALRTDFRRLMSKYPMTGALSILDTCYDLSDYNIVTLPEIRLLFRGNVEVAVAVSGILYAANISQACLAFAGNSDADDFAIFGNIQQQTLGVVHDVVKRRIGLGAGGCS